ncbi:hypothetical protein FOS14_17660 [Skermania sp. ID1734]|nr:hypothetical protein [Skermania sp. ID1734]TSD95713.1 hypothetical protein FOS14_17660 [Skermania sp. ID1734]
MVLGIVSVVLLCGGIGGIIGIVAWVLGKKTLNEIDASGGTVGGRSNVMVGYVLGIVSTCLMVLGILIYIGIGIAVTVSSST